MTIIAGVLAFIWGVIWALCLQTYAGRFLSARYTWVTVVIGVGVDLVIALLVLPIELWLQMVGIIAFSSVGIITRSLLNEHKDQRMLNSIVNGDQDPTRK